MDDRKTNVKRHPRKTRKGRTTVKRHNRSIKRLKQLGYSDIAKKRLENQGKPFRMTQKEIRNMDDKMPTVNKGDRVHSFFLPISKTKLSTIEAIILGKLTKEYDGDNHIYDLELNYEENLEIVLDDHPYRSPFSISHLYETDRFLTKEWLEIEHNKRSKKSIAMDERKSNQATLTIDEVLLIDEPEDKIDLGKIDIEKVDTPK